MSEYTESKSEGASELGNSWSHRLLPSPVSPKQFLGRSPSQGPYRTGALGTLLITDIVNLQGPRKKDTIPAKGPVLAIFNSAVRFRILSAMART